MDQALLFVYGTLRRGFYNQWQQILEKQGSWLGQATTSGYLYDLGAYPGAVYDPAGDPIIGDLYSLDSKNGRRILTVLDEYEGDEYARIQIQADFNGKEILSAYFYQFMGQADPAMRIFPADYRIYLQR